MSTDSLTHRAAALVDEIAMAEREGWSAKRIAELTATRQEVLDELHERAHADDVLRSIRHLEDRSLRSMAAFAELIDQSSPRTAIAIRVVRELLHKRTYFADGVWHCNCHAAENAQPAQKPQHGKGCSCCGAGFAQWR
ncbi:hypothetical protein ACFWIW_10810 [Amycolatopsis sp. NPDC058340]|uniref:hypothetical protein n=1 Tax=Amycolatopsis sp. NPDC058340 TaxID=3346453 RepID=UPI003659A2B9